MFKQILEQIGVLTRFKESSLLSGYAFQSPSNTSMNVDARVAQSIKNMQDSIRSFQRSCFGSEEQPDEESGLANVGFQHQHISVFGTAITRRNQILLRVLEAKDLKPLLMQGRHTYCKVVLKQDDTVLFREFTYRCDETTNPAWMDQRLLINIPDFAAAKNHKGFVLMVVVYSASIVGVDRFLGQVEIPLAVLKSEERIKGWFALRPKASSIKYSTNTLKVSGSLKLSAQWIYSIEGLLKTLAESTQIRLHSLHQLLNIVEDMQASQEADEGYRKRSLVKSSSHSNEGDITGLLKTYASETSNYIRKKTEYWIAKGRENRIFDKFDGRGIVFGRRESSSPKPSSNDLGFLLESSRGEGSRASAASRSPSPPPVRDSRRATVLMVQKRNWVVRQQSRFDLSQELGFTLASPPRKKTMPRNRSIRECQDSFVSHFDGESRRNGLMVNASLGVVEVTVIEALNLPPNKNPLLVKIYYGDVVRSTHGVMCRGNDVSWASGEDTDAEQEAPSTPNLVAFDIDTLNIRGIFRIAVMADCFPNAVEVASVELPFFSILSTVIVLEEQSYERWFPLLLSNQSIPIEGESGTQSHYLQKESLSSSDFGLRPCIKLGIRWRTEELSPSGPPKTAYAIFSLPAFSLAVIDSDRSLEVMEVSVQGVDVRYFESEATTEMSVNVLWVQIDNQLPQSAAPVILCPKRKIFAQPVLRILVRKNNVLSQSTLNSYEAIELILQELDVFLEQKQVIASWELLQSWVNSLDSSLVGSGAAINDAWAQLVPQVKTPPRDARPVLLRDDLALRLERHGEVTAIRSSTADGYVDNNKIYVESFVIGSIKINVSFIMSPNVQLSGHRPSAVKGVFFGDVSNLGYAFSILIRQIGDVVLDLTSAVTDAPIVLNGLEVMHLFKTDVELAKTLQEHYLNSFMRQVYKIVGSLDLVGNPIGLVSSLGNGVRDFFFEPAHALITNPTEIRKIGRGVVKGTMSLVSNVSGGTIITLSTFTRAAGRVVARMSGGDSAFIKRREELMKRPKSVLAAVTRPIKDVENGIYGGLIGLIKVPYNGAKRNGVYGFVSGIPMGLLGVVAKPVVGVLDAVSHVTESMGDAVSVLAKESQAPLRRRRLSNLFG